VRAVDVEDQLVRELVEAPAIAGCELAREPQETADLAALDGHGVVRALDADPTRAGALRVEAQVVRARGPDQRAAGDEHAHRAVRAVHAARVDQLREAPERLVALVAQVVGRHADRFGLADPLVERHDLVREAVDLVDARGDLGLRVGGRRTEGLREVARSRRVGRAHDASPQQLDRRRRRGCEARGKPSSGLPRPFAPGSATSASMSERPPRSVSSEPSTARWPWMRRPRSSSTLRWT
jgi:hypothetical protein